MTAVSTPTSAEVEPVIRTLLTRVVAAEDVHRALRRVTLTGPALADLDLPGPDAFFHLLLPPPGRSDLTVDESFSWEAHAATPARDRAVGAYSTVWDHRPDRAELDVLRQRLGSLTPREREVLPLVVSGLLNKQAAAELGISEVTVKLHRGNAMRKMEVPSLAALIRLWETLPPDLRDLEPR